MGEKKWNKKQVAMAGSLTAICVAGLTLVLVYGLPTKEKSTEKPDFVSPSRLGVFAKGAVSSDGVPCSDIGRDVLLEGGTAVDSAIATLFCVGVVNMHSAGIGGGFLMTVYDHPSRTAVALDARETAPLNATENMFHGQPELARKGPLSVAVPGELAGYWAAHQRFGKLPWSRLVLPSAKLAENGIRVSPHLADSLQVEAENIKKEPSMKVFLDPKTGEVLKAGDVIKRPAFGQTLRNIAAFGVDIFYSGTLGERLVEDVQQKGGILTMDDMRAYRAVWSDPITVKLKDNHTLYTSPPPGSGALLAYILNIVDDYSASGGVGGAGDPLTYHRIAEAFKHAYAHRTKLADPAYVDVTELVSNLTSEKFASLTRRKINDSVTFNDPGYYGAVTYQPDDAGTSHVSVLAPDGSAVSATSTINLRLGAGFMSTQTGIILNDEMDDFSAPNITNYFGVPPSPANFIRPGKRPLSSMCPMIIVDESPGVPPKVRFVAGAAGGTKITTATALTAIRNLWFGQDIKEAIDCPRFHHQLFPKELQFESGFPQDLVEALERKGHESSWYKTGAVVTAISVEKDGLVYANSDYRKGGDVAGL